MLTDDIASITGVLLPGPLRLLPGGLSGCPRRVELLCFLHGCGWGRSGEYVHRCAGLDPGCLDAPDLMPAGSMRSVEEEIPDYPDCRCMTEWAREPESFLTFVQSDHLFRLLDKSPFACGDAKPAAGADSQGA